MLSINSNLAKHVECGPDELIRHITRAVYVHLCFVISSLSSIWLLTGHYIISC